jgi:DNA-binding response OmpR family regulator
MSNLRSKLKAANPQKEYIETVWGLGYRLFKDS